MQRVYCLILVLICLAAQSCVNTQGFIIAYDEKLTEGAEKEYENYPLNTYKIRPLDNLAIKFNDFEDNTSNYLNEQSSLAVNNVNPALLYLTSYVVTEEGTITLPAIGKQQVAGLTLAQVKDTLDAKLTPFLKFASTSVKLSNFRVTVLGEVERPGTQNIYNEKTTLLQALSDAGDLTDFADITKVKVVRESEKGTITTYLNLGKPDFLSSEYYFLMPNDVIYIEPVKAKAFNVNGRTASVAISAVSVAALIANIIITNINSNN